MTSAPSPVWSVVASTVLVAVILGVLIYFDTQKQVLALLQWLDSRGAEAALWFIGIMVVVVVLLLPGVLFTTGAGFVFGVVKGTLLVVLGTTAGAVLAFLIARHLFGQRASRYLLNHVRLQRAHSTLEKEGRRIVMLTRLVPFFPFKLSNYFFGLTPVKLWDFIVGSFIGVIPFSLHNVYLGAIAADITTLGSHHGERSPLEWTFYGAGFVLVVVALLGLARIARKTLKAEGADLEH